MTALSTTLNILAWGGLIVFAALLAFVVFATLKYGPIIQRIFEVRPVFLPLHVRPEDEGEPVSFEAEGGVALSGSYLRRRTEARAGVLVFCHEYLSDRWSYLPYADHLRDRGFDVFTFDFRNHGTSHRDPGYSPLQWTTTFEVADLRAALRHLRSREDHDRAGFGLVGVSRGGTTALVVGAEQPDVWGVITDGAFPIRGTMTAYILRWAEIYINSKILLRLFPLWLYKLVGYISRRQSERKLRCRFPDVESAARRLAPRPWLAIHGEKDTYIGPDIARNLFNRAGQPKELWIVPGAKHNRCREANPGAYAARQVDFLSRKAPRPLVDPPAADVDPAPHAEPTDVPVHSDRTLTGSRLLPGIVAQVTG
ncbi:Alpha/beta hydrolase family protein [Aquisphaera giovannonii]|uniref:Alpha/beta hydrolase family protein n=1 Tax=Aquisphaera giovannonii TaxID=406548 RepID=A0A5B9W1V6_9BACT|nr:alpha/beta fold hydrolase [Aquisphaera giovannonii]QEH33985.1 Alpha/beta hydrolase family protein [Aquisphaera giovannonii]